MVITRFNPCLNGPLHLGHIFTCLVNEHFAHSVGGKFIIRFDDTSYTSNRTGCRMNQIRHLQKETLEWLEIPVDGWSLQSTLLDNVHKIINDGFHANCPDEDETGYVLPTSIRFGSDFVFYPYTPRQTVERVVMDHMIETTDIIRGDDFLTEYSLYSYFCQIFKYPTPRFWFLPRLSANGKDISKTAGGFTVAEYRANGYTPKDIKELLTKSCLIEPKNGWIWHNIKHDPTLIL